VKSEEGRVKSEEGNFENWGVVFDDMKFSILQAIVKPMFSNVYVAGSW